MNHAADDFDAIRQRMLDIRVGKEAPPLPPTEAEKWKAGLPQSQVREIGICDFCQDAKMPCNGMCYGC